MSGLVVSRDLTLPLSAVTGKHALLGSSGAGKSNAGVVLAEAMYDAGLIFVAIDPKGDWWGLRYGADAKTAGLEVPIFGGLHGDEGLALHPGSGEFIASLIVERRLRCVLDLSEMTKGEQTKFLADFADKLFRLKNANRFPLHLFLDEVDEYLPQKIAGGQRAEEGNAARCLGLWSRIVKQGRNRGIGITLMSQRSAVVNKDVLTQTETLIALRTTAPQDRSAIRAWVEHHALGKDLVNALPELENGEAWVWSPHAYKLMVNMQFSRRRTFDSGATPELGEDLEPPGRLAAVDIATIKDQMAETVEQAKANDPKALRRDLAEARREIADLRSRPTGTSEPQEIEVEVEVRVPTVPTGLVDTLQALTDNLRSAAERLGEQAAADVATVINQITSIDTTPIRSTPARPGGGNPAPPRRVERTTKSPAPSAPAPTRSPLSDKRDKPGDKRPLVTGPLEPVSGAPRRLMDVLVRFPDGCAKGRAASLAGISQRKSTLKNALAKLRKLGYIEESGDPLIPTAAGIETIGEPDPLPTGDELYAHWAEQLNPSQLACLDVLLAAWPDEVPRDLMAERTGMDPTQSTLKNAMAKVRALGLAHGWRADDDLVAAIRG